MNTDELYQEILLQHSRRPRNHGPLENPTHRADGHNALCGDELSVELRIVDDQLEAVRFQASACAICTASGSLMTGAVTGLKTHEATALAGDFRKLASTGEVAPAIESLTALRALGAVHRFPQRVKCATLAWETFSAAIREGAVAQG
jgi:nitrogen fixation protein NifU and related proteins